MYNISVQDAEKQLRRLIDAVERGEDVVITRDDGLSIQLVPISTPESTPRPTFGSAAGKIWMSEDFDTPLDDFDDYMPS